MPQNFSYIVAVSFIGGGNQFKSSTKQIISSHEKVTCSRQDMAEKMAHFTLSNNHSLTLT
jgi:hypothetical protein